jgi:hypothetical protein
MIMVVKVRVRLKDLLNLISLHRFLNLVWFLCPMKLCPMKREKGAAKTHQRRRRARQRSRDPNTKPTFTLHASRFTLHASRFTLHASRFTLHASRYTQQ